MPLRAWCWRDPKAAVREAARQFESLFMQELLKSMRAATMATGMLDNEAAASWAPRCWTRRSPASSAACRAACPM
jgi:hypothetical protein